MNLLIVEDSARMRGMIKQVVGDLAERVYECEDGDDALAAYSANQPDWVLMDIQMKNTNGLTATRQIVSEFADAKIVIVTNYDDAPDRFVPLVSQTKNARHQALDADVNGQI